MDIVAYDIEATGLNTQHDRIVEIALLEAGTDPRTTKVFRCNPGIPITPGATKVHGITDADVADNAGFDSCAKTVQKMIEGKVLLTYSGRAFDTLMLDAELRRCGQPGIDLENVQEIDLYRVWAESEPRSLEGAVSRFLVQDHEGAHGAMADARVLPDLMEAMSFAFAPWKDGLPIKDSITTEAMIGLSKPEWEADRSGKLRKNDDGVIVWNFGRTRGEAVWGDEGLIRWVLDRDFPPDTKAILEGILQEMYAVGTDPPGDDDWL